MNKEDYFAEVIMITLFSGLPRQEAEPEDYTGEDGLFCIGELPPAKEAYFPEGKTLSDVTDTPKNVTASGNAGNAGSRRPGEHKHREEVERLK